LAVCLTVLSLAAACSASDRAERNLRSGDPRRQMAAADQLRARPDRRAVPALRQALASPNFEVRRACAEAIARSGDRPAQIAAARVMARDTSDADPQRAQAALQALRTLGGPALPELVTAATLTAQPPLREAALEALLDFPRDAEPEDRTRAARILLDALGEANPVLFEASFQTLLIVLRPLFDELAREGLVHPAANVRQSVVAALGRVRDARAGELVLGMMADSAPSVRAEAARSLGLLGYRAAAGALRYAAVSDRDMAVRDAAVDALARIEGAQP
jgi:HEAT repeat protein